MPDVVTEFVAECRTIAAGEDQLQQLRAAMTRLLEHADLLAETYPAPVDSDCVSGESDELFEDETVAVMIVHAPPGVKQPPHDHLMSVVIGGFRGHEHQRLFRRTPDGERAIEPAGTSVVSRGDVFSLGAQGVHAIEATGTEWSSAMHVYLGQLSAAKRSMFHPDTFAEEPMDLSRYDSYCES